MFNRFVDFVDSVAAVFDSDSDSEPIQEYYDSRDLDEKDYGTGGYYVNENNELVASPSSADKNAEYSTDTQKRPSSSSPSPSEHLKTRTFSLDQIFSASRDKLDQKDGENNNDQTPTGIKNSITFEIIPGSPLVRTKSDVACYKTSVVSSASSPFESRQPLDVESLKFQSCSSTPPPNLPSSRSVESESGNKARSQTLDTPGKSSSPRKIRRSSSATDLEHDDLFSSWKSFSATKILNWAMNSEDDVEQDEVLIAEWEKFIVKSIQSPKSQYPFIESKVWKGLPTAVRGRVWKAVINNHLDITEETYRIYLKRAKTELYEYDHQQEMSQLQTKDSLNVLIDKDSNSTLIRIDACRTFPKLSLFKPEGPFHEDLRNILEAMVCLRPDVGYVQGMSYLAAVLLLNMSAVDSFICLTNLLMSKLLTFFFTMNPIKIAPYLNIFDFLFSKHLNRLFAHMTKLGVDNNIYLYDWFMTLFSRSLPLDLSLRVWDNYLVIGDSFLFRTALGILSMYSERIFSMDFEGVAYFLTHLPDDLDSKTLFQCIDKIKVKEEKLDSLLIEYTELAGRMVLLEQEVKEAELFEQERE